eukprot:1014071-Amphidinium_carterae.2
MNLRCPLENKCLGQLKSGNQRLTRLSGSALQRGNASTINAVLRPEVRSGELLEDLLARAANRHLPWGAIRDRSFGGKVPQERVGHIKGCRAEHAGVMVHERHELLLARQ